MEKIIEIDISDKYDLVDKYNEKKISRELLEYIIKQAGLVKRKHRIKIMINKRCNIDKDITKLIKQGLKEEYNRSLEEYHHNNKKQLFLFGLGIMFIFLSTLIKDGIIWKELLLIGGWVPIWEMVELELINDVAGRRRRKIIKKIMEG